jgi:hypothetical protein
MSAKKPLHTIAVASTELNREAFLDCSGIEPTIRFGYELEGVSYVGGIAFSKVSALRKRSERCCTAWHIEEAYDTLVEIEASTWLDELRADIPEAYRKTWAAHHYMIYLDSSGCFEFAAESWKALEPQQT